MGAIARLAVSGTPTPDLGTREWFSEFFLSPAVAGFAALIAALLGVYSTVAHLRANRAEAHAERLRVSAAASLVRQADVEDRDRAQWWESYKWAAGHSNTLEPRKAVDLFTALSASAPDEVSAALVAALVSSYRRGLPEPRDSEIVVYTRPGSVQTRATLRALDRARASYVVVDITEDADARDFVLSLGHLDRDTVVVVHGRDSAHWSGYRPDMLRRYTQEGLEPTA